MTGVPIDPAMNRRAIVGLCLRHGLLGVSYPPKVSRTRDLTNQEVLAHERGTKGEADEHFQFFVLSRGRDEIPTCPEPARTSATVYISGPS